MRAVIFLCLLLFLPEQQSYKILVYNPRFAHSHTNFLANLGDILAEAGHNVTSLMPIYDESVKATTTKTKIIGVMPPKDVMNEARQLLEQKMNLFETKIFDVVMAFVVSHIMGGLYSRACKGTLEQPGLLETLTNEHYDVYIAESFDTCGLGIAHLIKPKALITASTTILLGEQYDDLGIPNFPSFNPSMYTVKLDPHSFASRAWNLLGEFLVRRFFGGMRSRVRTMFVDKYGKDFPTWQEISSHVAYGFANAEPLIDFAHPTLHRIVNIPGIGAKDPKPLEQKWLDILSQRTKTVLISFGSITGSYQMNVESKRSVLKMVNSFPDVTFIWKYEKLQDEFAINEASKIDNLVLTEWMPQNDLLSDERVVAFISHGGMGSVQETARRGVPGLFIPLGGDQPRNAAMMQHNGLGRVFDKFDLPYAHKLLAAFRPLLEDPSYLSRARHVSHMLAKKPFTSREQLIKHVEFTAEFGPSPALRPQSYDMSVIEYHNLDILLIALLLSIAILYIGYIIACKLLNKMLSRKQKSD